MEAAIGPRPMADARVGQKTGTTRRWARRGTRPSAPKDLRTVPAYIFGAICPARGVAAGLVMPHCNTEAMAAHLAEISRHVARGAQAVLILDQAGWHASAALSVPDNITLFPLPPKCPAPDQVRGEPRRKHLAVPARQLVVQYHLCNLRRHRAGLLQSLEQPQQPTRTDNLHRTKEVGPWVKISENWYNTNGPMIPTCADQNSWAHWRCPMDMMRPGWPINLFQASQQ